MARTLTQEEVAQLPMGKYIGLIKPIFFTQGMTKDIEGDISKLFEEPLLPIGSYTVQENDEGEIIVYSQSGAIAKITDDKIEVRRAIMQEGQAYAQAQLVEKQSIKLTDFGTIQSTFYSETHLGLDGTITNPRGQIIDEVYTLEGEPKAKVVESHQEITSMIRIDDIQPILYGNGNINPDSNRYLNIDFGKTVYAQVHDGIPFVAVSEVEPITKETTPPTTYPIGEYSMDKALETYIVAKKSNDFNK